MPKRTPSAPDIRSLLEDGFNEATARSLYAQGEEVVIFALLQLAALALQTTTLNGTHPFTPSAAVPAFHKEPSKKHKKKPGAKPGHKGSRRPPPIVNRHESHRLQCCPDCGTKLNKRNQVRTRLTEDIPDNIVPEVTEHTIHRDYCPQCKKIVEPIVPDAMPNAAIGNRAVVLSAFLHYLVGTTISQIIAIFNSVFYFKLSPGGLIHLWHNLASVLKPWYEEIAEAARNAGVLHADETGWRVNGKTHWLWCFISESNFPSMGGSRKSCYKIIPFKRRVIVSEWNRSSPVVTPKYAIRFQFS
jgi:transposase